MKIIANRQLHGVYGTLNPDEEVDINYYLAKELLKAKLVRLPMATESIAEPAMSTLAITPIANIACAQTAEPVIPSTPAPVPSKKAK